MSTPYIIAEVGVNHDGDVDEAHRLVDIAADCGADAVKFQTFRADELASPATPKATYQLATTDESESQLAMLRRLELPQRAHHELRDHADERGLDFLSTAFDATSLSFLVEDLGIARIKIPSGELVNAPFVHRCACTGLPLIMSTGMADELEIAMALAIVVQAIEDPERVPRVDKVAVAPVPSRVAERVVVLHCTTEYPAPVDGVHLAAMDTIADRFGVPVGYSDHTEGIAVAIAAAARGASLIEKHLTSDCRRSGPDHRASLEPEPFAEMVTGIRIAARAIGLPDKRPSEREKANRVPVRQSLAVLERIAAGEPFTEDNLGTRRPGSGVPPADYWKRLGTVATRAYEAGELLDP